MKKHIKPFLFGLASSLAFAPVYFFPVIIAFSFLLRLLVQAKSKKESFIIGWFFGFGHFFVGFYWISIALFSDMKFIWLLPFSLILVPMVFAFYISLVSIGFHIINTKFSPPKFLQILTFASLFYIQEIVRSYLFTGFPWNLIGDIWGFSDKMIQVASVIGIYGLGFLTMIIACSFINKKTGIFAIILTLTVYLYGYNRLRNEETNYIPNVNVRLVQPNIKQNQKWSEEMIFHGFIKNLEIASEDLPKDITHIIMSESAVPYILQEGEITAKISDFIPSNVKLVTGALRQENHQYFNSIFMLENGKISDYYDKTHLVPFGEYVPLLDSSITGFGFTEGTERKIIDKFLPLICYEIIFPFGIDADLVEKAEFIVNVTNDAWYGRSSGPYQHFQSARMRAVENGISVIRVANTGISGIIDPFGRVVGVMELNEEGYIDSKIPQKIDATIYQKWGKWFIPSLIIKIIIGYFVHRAIFRKKKFD